MSLPKFSEWIAFLEDGIATFLAIGKVHADAAAASTASSRSLSSILNNPHVGKSDWWWSSSSSSSLTPPEFAPLISKSASKVSQSDFLPYLASVSEPYH
uniref:Uncharacterized protein n=1 Tax=Fagus sylvatica TaxID=28930 RepID=A0A2N9FJV2_FAGSY